MITRTKHLLFRFGQISTLGVAAALAMAAAPLHPSAPDGPTRLSDEVLAPPVTAEARPQPRFITFEHPVVGLPINSNFGMRHLAGEQARMHEGVDIAAPSGSRVLASAEGTVVRTGFDTGYGNFIELRHPNGVRTFYGHLSAIESGIQSGARVGGGQLIGRVGSTGHSTGPHLHFEVRTRTGAKLNPIGYIDQTFEIPTSA